MMAAVKLTPATSALLAWVALTASANAQTKPQDSVATPEVAQRYRLTHQTDLDQKAVRN